MILCSYVILYTRITVYRLQNNNNNDKGRHGNAAYAADIHPPSAREISDGRRSGKCRSSRRRRDGLAPATLRRTSRAFFGARFGRL